MRHGADVTWMGMVEETKVAGDPGIFLGQADEAVHLTLRYANRHGLIAGATGTGKTVSLQVLAEGFSTAGVPVFLADVKGDLSGLCAPGDGAKPFVERAQVIGLEPYDRHAFPCVFWDVFAEQGHPLRATISEMGPLLMARMLDLNDTQEGVLNVAFALADDEGLLLLDLKDLRAILTFVAENARSLSATYGLVSPTSVAAIQRRLLVLTREGADGFFGEPAIDIDDLIRCAPDGRGYVHVLAADRLIHSPRLYATFLMWLLSELFEDLPEIGDPDKPKVVLFFDEAHLLFDRAPRVLLDKVEQVVRLVRSKGVGVFFITQSPTDVPDGVLGQLGNRVQHALRAFTGKDKRAIRAAADTFRANPTFATEAAITEVGVGEALVSTLENKGTPGVVQRTLIRPPASRVGPASAADRAAAMRLSPYAGRYDHPFDRESAYEILGKRAEAAAAEAEASRQAPPPQPKKPAPRRSGFSSRQRQTPVEAMTTSAMRTFGREVGRQLVRGLLGGLFRGR